MFVCVCVYVSMPCVHVMLFIVGKNVLCMRGVCMCVCVCVCVCVWKFLGESVFWMSIWIF